MARRPSLTAISRAPLDKLLAYRDRMGWDIPWASSFGTSSNVNVAVSFIEQQPAAGDEYPPLDAALVAAHANGNGAG